MLRRSGVAIFRWHSSGVIPDGIIAFLSGLHCLMLVTGALSESFRVVAAANSY